MSQPPTSSLPDRLLARLSRVTSGHKIIAEIDGLRFFAIFLVVIAHALEVIFAHKGGYAIGDNVFVEALLMGGTGVQLFFVISGFILAVPFIEWRLLNGKAVSLPRYYWRRVTRLEPPYIAAMTVWFAIHWLLKGRALAELAPHYLSSISYTHFFVYGEPSLLLFAAWSLEIEVQFYVLTPMLACVFLIRGAPLRRALLLAGIVFSTLSQNWLTPEQLHQVRFTLLGQLHFFLAGYLLADIWLHRPADEPRKQWGWDLVATAAWAVIAFYPELKVAPGYQMLLLSVAAFTAYYGCFKGRFWNAVVTNRWIVTIGGMCYSLYLFHRLVLSVLLDRFLVRFSPTGWYWADVAILVAVTLLLTAAIGAVIFALVERPFMRSTWPADVRRWWQRRRGGMSVPSQEEAIVRIRE